MSCNNLSLCWLKSEHVISKVVKFCCLFATIDFTSLRYFSLGINNLPFMIYSISSACLRTHCQQPVYFIFENTVSDFLKFVGPSGQKITRNSNTAKFAGPGFRQNCLFVYFVLHQKSEMQLVCRNDHGQLGIRFCFKWHLLLKHATVFMVILLIIVFL